MKTEKQDPSFWESKESIKRYAQMRLELTDTELMFLFLAVQKLGKPIQKITILDLGCGGGRTTVPLHLMGFPVTGLDISLPLVKVLKERYPRIQVVQGDASKLKFKTGTFDIVLFSHNSLDCLYPYQVRQQALKEISRVLKPKGFFIFSSHQFNPVPFNASTLWNVLHNFFALPKLLTRGAFYKERMEQGGIVDLYASPSSQVGKELQRNSLRILKKTPLSFSQDNIFGSAIRIFLSWEITYLTQKEK